MRFLAFAVAAGSLLVAAQAHALSCSIGGTSHPCDVICDETFPGGPNPCKPSGQMPTTLLDCDGGEGSTPDGVCTICGQSGCHDTNPNTACQNRANRIQGTSGPDWICGRAGPDEIDGNGGDDSISGGDHDDEITGGPGNDDIRGDDGIDTIEDNDGDDRVDGGAGNDIIIGGDGANVLIGGTGNDSITVASSGPVHDALGNSLCGGAGLDTLVGTGDGHVCFDGGTNSGGSDACTYTSPLVDVHDVATKASCEISSGTFEPQVRNCGCP